LKTRDQVSKKEIWLTKHFASLRTHSLTAMFIRKQMKYIILLVLNLSLSGCEILEDIFSDCIDFDGPEFNKTSIPSAVLNEVYDVTIKASINNEPNDSYYEYTITVNGTLPSGVSIYRDNNDQTIQISGTPTESGAFHFTLKVSVSEPESYYDPYDDGSDLCYTTHEEDYVLTVNAI